MFSSGPVVVGCFAGITCVFIYVDVHVKEKKVICSVEHDGK